MTQPGFSGEQWDAFADLAIERHRVAPALAAALVDSVVIPPERVSIRLRDAARAAGMLALSQRAESLRLAELLAAAGIEAIWLKGWPLAEHLYGAPGLRHASDIDILVPPAERLSAARVLNEAGYEAADENGVRGRLIAHPVVGRECKDVIFHHPGRGLVIELHWRTNHFDSWPDLFDLDEASEIAVPDPTPIRVPGPLGQLIYLSCHGQQHLFSRLKWLLDIAHLARHRGARLVTDLDQAEQAGAGTPVRLALELARQVFGASVPALSLAQQELNWVDQIAASIGDPRAAPGLVGTRLGFYRWHWRMADGSGQRLGVLRDLTWRRVRLGLTGLIH